MIRFTFANFLHFVKATSIARFLSNFCTEKLQALRGFLATFAWNVWCQTRQPTEDLIVIHLLYFAGWKSSCLWERCSDGFQSPKLGPKISRQNYAACTGYRDSFSWNFHITRISYCCGKFSWRCVWKGRWWCMLHQGNTIGTWFVVRSHSRATI